MPASELFSREEAAGLSHTVPAALSLFTRLTLDLLQIANLSPRMPDPSSPVFQNILDSKYFCRPDLLSPTTTSGQDCGAVCDCPILRRRKGRRKCPQGQAVPLERHCLIQWRYQRWAWSTAVPADMLWHVREHICLLSFSWGKSLFLKLA